MFALPSLFALAFQSTLPAGEATHRFYDKGDFLNISIHASRGGSDAGDGSILHFHADFNPRFPRGKRRGRGENMTPSYAISIHASRGGSDPLPTPSMLWGEISIHASRGGSDTPSCPLPWGSYDFNPRFPRGKRRLNLYIGRRLASISIHASRGGSDMVDIVFQVFNAISIHASRGGSDPMEHPAPALPRKISIHASRGGSDCAVKRSPNYRTWRHGLREPGFHRFFYRHFPCFFLLGAWGSRL